MTHGDGIDLALNLAGGVGISASVVVGLTALDGGDVQDVYSGLRLLCIGVVSMLAARPAKLATLSGEKPGRRDPPGT
jgi:hypothetical protein